MLKLKEFQHGKTRQGDWRRYIDRLIALHLVAIPVLTLLALLLAVRPR
jgi:hypothetical protein